MKKIVVKIDLHDDRDKQKAMKAVSSIAGIDQIAIDMGKKELTVIGDVDPVDVVTKLRKHWHPEILTVGPAKEPEKKKEEPKKEEPKKEEKKEEKKGGGDEKKKDPNEHIQELVKSYQAWNPQMTTHYHVSSMEENPNTCTIC